ncbi:MA3 domain-containing protein [Rhynchospora pubera]|uniref:MA3 domain-containing protein n=1 Tax=Rhynchospora pubera TaxID=906938 RepID=A0AAV8DZ34_9POAL|nr:MA3 domain-containing protein [Rhynchospora pubera]
MLALFISEAGDTILHPDFIGRVKELLPETSKGIEVIKIAEKSYPSFPHHAERLERHWGGTIWLTVEDDKKKLIDLLRAYAENGDSGFRMHKTCVSHLEVVKQAITLAMEKPDLEANVLRLLKEANEKLLKAVSQKWLDASFISSALAIGEVSDKRYMKKAQLDRATRIIMEGPQHGNLNKFLRRALSGVLEESMKMT